MGDRTHVTVRVLEGHEDRFGEIIGDEPSNDLTGEPIRENGWVRFEMSEAEGGLYDEALEAAEEELVFIGENGAGGEYGPAVWCAYDGVFYHAESDWNRLYPVIRMRIDEKGTVDFDMAESKEATFYLFASMTIERIFEEKSKLPKEPS